MAQKSMKRKKAFFITLEGLEGSGKSSVIDFLENYFRQRKFTVKIFREPGSTLVGEKIRTILLDKENEALSAHTELLLYLAARTQLIEEKLTKAFSRYDVIICDRFFDSTLVYQGIALGLGRVVDKAVEIFSLGVKPDLTIVLDLPVEQGLSRIKEHDRIESRPRAFHEKLRKGYLALARRFPKRIKVIDARGSLKEIFARVEALIKRRLNNGKKG